MVARREQLSREATLLAASRYPIHLSMQRFHLATICFPYPVSPRGAWTLLRPPSAAIENGLIRIRRSIEKHFSGEVNECWA
jgi:hypothetical protein